MKLQEPNVEFVPIDQNVLTQAASGCPDYATQVPVGGGQRCIGTQPEADDCPDDDTDTVWL